MTHKIKTKKKIKMTQAERIAKAKAILAEIETFDMEEQQTRLDVANTPIKKLFKGLHKFTFDIESWTNCVSNNCCSENIGDIMQNPSRMTTETLKRMLNSLEIPYKMWRRIDAYLKRHGEGE